MPIGRSTQRQACRRSFALPSGQLQVPAAHFSALHRPMQRQGLRYNWLLLFISRGHIQVRIILASLKTQTIMGTVTIARKQKWTIKNVFFRIFAQALRNRDGFVRKVPKVLWLIAQQQNHVTAWLLVVGEEDYQTQSNAERPVCSTNYFTP